MEKFQALMEKTLVPFATKLSNNKVLKAISGGFGMLLPISSWSARSHRCSPA